MTWSELERKLKRETKCRYIGERKGHHEWENPETGETFTMGRHKTQQVKAKTLHTILKIAGLK